MTTIEKIEWLYEECFQDLDDWQKEFISDLYHHCQDPDEELTRRQIEKVDEIWEGQGL